MEAYYTQRNKLNELILGQYSFNDLSVNIRWFHMLLNVSPYNRKYHSHPDCELHLMIEGSNVFYCRENNQTKDFLVESGQGILIPPRCEHRITSYGNKRFLKYDLCFGFGKSSELNELFKSVYNSDQIQVFQFTDEQKSILDECLKAAVNRRKGFRSRIQLKLLEFQIILAQDLTPEVETVPQFQIHRLMDDDRYYTIHQYIIQNIDKQISSCDISGYMNLSARQINRIISKSSEHKNATSMIAALKIDMAKKLLVDPQLRVADVASMLGFSNEYYFNRFFKKSEGMPPGHYRETLCAKTGDSLPAFKTDLGEN